MTMNGQNPAAQEPVIIVGAGPAGCTAALLLADLGIPVTLLERHTQPHPLPRAVHLDDEVARTLGRIGVSEGFLDRSRPGSGLRLLDAGHRVMAEFTRDHKPPPKSPPCDAPSCLAAARPDACALANNHVLDFGRRRLEARVRCRAADGGRRAACW